MWPAWDDPRVCLGGRQKGKWRSQSLNLDPANKKQPPIWPHCWSVNGSLPISPLPLSILCAPPREASRQKCTLAELYSFKMMLTSDKGGGWEPSEWLSVLWTNTSIAVKVPFSLQTGLSAVSLPWSPNTKECCLRVVGDPTLSSLSRECLFSHENVGNQSCVCSCQGYSSGSSRQESGRISNILNDSTICKQYTIHLLVWEGECIHEWEEKLTKQIK